MTHPKFGIVIIDVWNGYHPHHGFMLDLIEHYVCTIGEMLDQLKDAKNPLVDIPIVLSCGKTDKWATGPHHMIWHRCMPGTNHRIVSNQQAEIINLLNSHNVSTVYFCGLSLPGCIDDRPVGLKAMREYFNVSVIADCTLDLFSPYKNPFDRINSMYRYMRRMEYSYVFSKDLIESYRGYSSDLRSL